jgi:hypothetical protein
LNFSPAEKDSICIVIAVRAIPVYTKEVKMTQLQTLLNRKQTAEVLGIKPQTLASWVVNQRYDLPYVKIGRRVMYKLADLNAFIARNSVGAVA